MSTREDSRTSYLRLLPRLVSYGQRSPREHQTHVIVPNTYNAGAVRAALERLSRKAQGHGTGLGAEPKAQRIQAVEQRRQAGDEAFARGPRQHSHRAGHPEPEESAEAPGAPVIQ